MKKITCANSNCGGTVFQFDEQKYPNATEVKCPKCKHIQRIQPLPSIDPLSWLKQDLTAPQVVKPKPQMELPALETEPILSLMTSNRTFALKLGKNFIGRRADNDVVLDQDEHISRRHAVVEVFATPNANWRYIVYDIGNLGETQSKNGIYVGSRRLSTFEQLNLVSGNTFQLGDTKLSLG
ncbi:MAG: Inner rane component of cytoplasmic domain [Bacteroidota bacterium]|jgi:pSer/pThr/pTyr-binding forkhead associated (FHA) protein